MKFRKSIRWRLQAWYGALLLAVVAGFCFTSYRLERANALKRFDDELGVRVELLSKQLSRGERARREDDDRWNEPEDRQQPPPSPFEVPQVAVMFNRAELPAFYFHIWTRDDGLLERSGNAPEGIPHPESPARSGQSGPDHGVRDREGVREIYHFTPPGECLLVGRSTADLDKGMRDFALKLAATGAIVLFTGLGIGAWISGRALRPIDEISAAAVRIAGGNLKERIRTGDTESELGRLASVLDDTFQKLDAAFEEQARFTSDAAHELRTPVSIVLAYCQLALAKERDPQQYRESIEVMQRSARRMQGLIESLLQLSIVDGSPGASARTSCDLTDIAREQAEAMQPLAEEKGLNLTLDLEPARCMADADQMAQIVSNLLTNAVKFCHSGAIVTVSTKQEGREAVLSVSDTGPGIEPQNLPHLFERFYRTDSSRNRSTGGAGLGLAICQRIAEAHGGRMEADSIFGKGSTFILRLPKIPAEGG